MPILFYDNYFLNFILVDFKEYTLCVGFVVFLDIVGCYNGDFAVNLGGIVRIYGCAAGCVVCGVCAVYGYID